MTKSYLFAVALLSLVVAGGCAKGGNGIVPSVTVTATSPVDVNALAIYPTQKVTLTAVISNSTATSVTWSLSGTNCTGTPNPCGTLTSPAALTVNYVAPTAPTSLTVVATLVGDTSVTGPLPITVVPVTVVVTPLTVNVGQGLTQQFTAVAVPDDAPQTFDWACTPSSACGNFTCVPSNACNGNAPGVAVYTAPSSYTGSVTVTATSSISQGSGSSPTVSVVPVSSLLAPGPYGFQFSGYDHSGAVAAAGTVTVSSNGSIAGFEDTLTSSGPTPYTITSGSYQPISSGDFSNNRGTLTLHLSGGATDTYTAVLTSAGIVRLIDSAGTGSGTLQPSGTDFNKNAQTFAFGFTGVDSDNNRAGYVGLLPMSPINATSGNIAGGMIDSNDNGRANSYSSVTGTYKLNANGSWGMTLTFGSGPTTLDFDFYVSSGSTQSQTKPGDLTLYAISTDPVDSTHPALSGSMAYQVPMSSGYTNASFNGTSVSALTGANANVSLTVGQTDGTSGGTGGTGGLAGSFDQNNNGTIISAAAFPGGSQTTNPYTYVATSSAGRYIFYLLGNPTGSSPVNPIPFVLYASGANRGFLLDQNSSSVITGAMYPQPTLKNFSYTFTELPGVFAAATLSNSDPSIAPVVQNLLVTSPGGTPPVYNVAGTQNPNSVALAGSYTVNDTPPGTGTITLTSSPLPPLGANYVIYAIDAVSVPSSSNDVITDFMMMATCVITPPATTCTAPPSSIIFAQQ